VLYGVAALPAVSLDLAAATAGLFLLAGLWTPIAGTLMAAAEGWIAFSRHSSQADLSAHLLLAVIGAGLALLGPGAWSVDSRLFGRRRFDIGNGTHTPLK
jgi:uncharacterized membrane protein YphA (DoxX/SURF4 family)